MILVVKLSGKVLEEPVHRDSLCLQVSRLWAKEHALLLVHGGGKQLSQLCRERGIPVIRHAGRRVTDAATLEAAKLAFSALNRELVAALQARGVRAVGFSAFDGGLTRCRRRPPLSVPVLQPDGSQRLETVDFGLIGEILSVDPTLIHLLWQGGITPVVSCLCSDERGQILNINADTLAAELAAGLSAHRLISVSDVDGIYLDPRDLSTRLTRVSLSQLQSYLEEGIFTEGMVPKVQAAMSTLARGVPAVQIVSGLQENALLESLEERSGTLLYGTEGN